MSKIYIIRPLIFCTKKTIVQFIEKNQLYFQNDYSNKNKKFTRVRVRSIINNFNNNIIKKLILLNSNVTKSKNFLNNYSQKIFSLYCLIRFSDKIIITTERYLNLEFEIFIRLTTLVIKKIFNNYNYPIKIRKLKFLFNKAHEREFSKFIINKCLIIKTRNKIYIFQE